MPDDELSLSTVPSRTPWNKGKLIGAKPPLWPMHVWSIRTRLMIEGRTRDLAMFNLAIDSKLRGCDVVALKGRGRRTQRLYDRTRDGSTEEDGTAGQVRADRADTASNRRLPASGGQ